MTTKQEIQALERFIQNIYTAESLSSDESIGNLEKSLVEIVYKDTNTHAANGLLITSSGYFLTASHCADKYSEKLIQDYRGNLYFIERVCQNNPNEDIALLKIKQDKCQRENYDYKIKNINLLLKDYALGYLIEHKSRWDGEVINKFGKIKGTKREFQCTDKDGKDSRHRLLSGIETEIKSIIPGDSGGILLSYSGELIGLTSAKSETFEVFTTIFSGLNLVQKEINTLKSPLKRFLRKLSK